MSKGPEPDIILSFAQQKLGALLSKTKELLPFADDDECENAFALLADFAQGTLEHKDERRRTSQFDGMKLEDLLRLRVKSKGGFCARDLGILFEFWVPCSLRSSHSNTTNSQE